MALGFIYDNSKHEECSYLMPASLVYSKRVMECLLHCLLNIRDAFLCHNLRLHKLKNCGIAYLKKLFLFHVLDCNAIFANQDPLPTLRPGNFDLHTKMPGSAPA